jgi:hypothetical protein
VLVLLVARVERFVEASVERVREQRAVIRLTSTSPNARRSAPTISDARTPSEGSTCR